MDIEDGDRRPDLARSFCSIGWFVDRNGVAILSPSETDATCALGVTLMSHHFLARRFIVLIKSQYRGIN